MDPTPARSPSLLDPQLLWAMVALVATLLLGAVIFAWLDRWRKRGDRDTLTPAHLLTDFRQSYERGELSQQEYERIRAKLAPKLREQVKLPPKPPTNPPTTDDRPNDSKMTKDEIPNDEGSPNAQ